MLRNRMIRATAYLVAVVMMFGSVLSYALPVGKITVVNEGSDKNYDQSVLEERVSYVMRTQVGREFSDYVLNEDLKNLMLSGSFSNVRVVPEDSGNGQKVVTVYVVPKPFISGILFEGNKEFTSGKLSSVIEEHLTIGMAVSEHAKAKARKAILDKYADDGFFSTIVKTTEKPAPDGNGTMIVFEIKEAPHYKLEGVYFRNNTVFTESQLRDVTVTKRQWWRYIIRFGNYFNELQLADDKEGILRTYRNAGYLDATVTDVELEYDEDKTWVKVIFVLSEGNPYKVTGVEVKGNAVFTGQELVPMVRTQGGDTYNQDREQADLRRIKSKYAPLGYLELKTWPEHKKNPAEHTVSVVYHVEEGTISHVRDILIVGNDITQDKVIRRELTIKPQDLGDPDKVENSQKRLMNLGYFSKVDIVPAVTEVADLRDLRVEVEEKPTGTVSLGGAYSTEDSLMGTLELGDSNFDLGRLLDGEWPPRGGGQRFMSRLMIGGRNSSVSISLDEPWFLDRRLTLSTELFLANHYEDEYDQRNVGGQMLLTWPVVLPFLPSRFEKNWRMSTGVRLEHVRISDADEYDDSHFNWDDAPKDCVKDRVVADSEGGYWANRLLWRMNRDTRDRYFFATEGSLFNIGAELVTSALGSYENYVRLNMEDTVYIPVLNGRVLKLNGFVATATGDDKVEIFDRYFAGGVGTIRGFKRRTVSPVDRHEDPLGGNTMLTGTIELYQPISDIAFASVFTDAGNVWEKSFDFGLSDVSMSVGVGLQFRPLPLSLFYGIPVIRGCDHLKGSSGRFHFNIGFNY